MSSEIALTPTSYIVLGLLSLAGRANPYELKQGAAGSVGNFWSLPHSQLYAEPDRLAAAGYVTVERETTGRRRKVYELTDRGRAALAAWVADPHTDPPELRDPALLKIFFGADPGPIAAQRLEAHRAKLTQYRALHDALKETAPGPALTLEAGIAFSETWIAFWERLAAE